MAVQFLAVEAIEEKAQEFLSTYHSVMTLPIPIEEIVEYQMHLDIVPTVGLHHTAATSGWISSDLTAIFVDENQFSNYHNRYRFTLAHEVAHVILHREYYSEHEFASTADWKVFMLSIDDEDQGRLEFQANEFAGRILVPTAPLTAMYAETKKRIQEIAAPNVGRSVIVGYAARHLSAAFQVSPQCMEIRINRQFWP